MSRLYSTPDFATNLETNIDIHNDAQLAILFDDLWKQMFHPIYGGKKSNYRLSALPSGDLLLETTQYPASGKGEWATRAILRLLEEDTQE